MRLLFAMKRTRLIKIVDCICAILLIGCTVWVACQYGSLPDRIPTHYNANGIIDGYGSKSMIWTVIAIMWVLVGLMSAGEQIPRLWNTWFKLIKENHSRLLALTWLFSTTKLVVSVMFAYIVVMCVIGNNVALSLGMVGALSIVRFRTAIKDARDTAYIFWCVAAGICCGISDFTIAACGSAVLFLLMLAVGNNKSNSRYLLIIRGAYSGEDSAKVESYISGLFKDGARLCVKNRSLGCIEYIYELSTRQAEQFRNENGDDEIFSYTGTESVNLVGQNDEIVG